MHARAYVCATPHTRFGVPPGLLPRDVPCDSASHLVRPFSRQSHSDPSESALAVTEADTTARSSRVRRPPAFGFAARLIAATVAGSAGPPTAACTAGDPTWSMRIPQKRQPRRPKGSWWQWHRDAARRIVATERAVASALITLLGSAFGSRASRPLCQCRPAGAAAGVAGCPSEVRQLGLCRAAGHPIGVRHRDWGGRSPEMG